MPPLSHRIIQNMAEKAAREAGFTSLPICPIKVAEGKGIVVRPKPDTAKGCSGMLLRNGEQFGIMYATHIKSEGFWRFSIGHEIGHHCLPGHPDAVLKNGVHESQAGFVARDKYEQEADAFAAALLMPEDFFKAEMRKLDGGMAAIEALADKAKASLPATGFRYAELTREPVAVVLSEAGKIVSCMYSTPMKDLSKQAAMPWLSGRPLPRGTATASFNAVPSRVESLDREEVAVDVSDWFGVGDGVRGTEQIIGLGDYGRTLTVIRCAIRLDDDYDPEEEADSEEYLTDRWTPRFHRK